MRHNARVIVASNRAAGGIYPDRTGPMIHAWLSERSFQVPEPIVVGDGEPVGHALRRCLAEDVRVVLTTGGTGISPTDQTPEMTRPLLDRELPGLADAIRRAGLPKVPTAVLSRGVAGVAGQTLVINLPGSTGGVADGLAVLDELLDHAIEQLLGQDHRHGAHSPARPAATVLRAVVTEEPLSVDEHAKQVGNDAAGAVVTFAGVVRDHDHGRPVRSLHYEGHPTASNVIATVAEDVAATSPGVRALAVSHRIGDLAIGDTALACAVSADHRTAAFTACANLVDAVKANLPVWKHQHFTDGTEEWVNSP